MTRIEKTICHRSFIADEEIGGLTGMAKFVVSEEFKKLNIGLALDEGLASPDDVVPVFYGERNMYWVKFHCKGEERLHVETWFNGTITGKPGHGSRFIEDTAAAKVQFLINKLLSYRETQRKLFAASPEMTLGDVTTVNLTMMSGGVQMNVVPNEFTVGFDIRITPTTQLADFDKMLKDLTEEVRLLSIA